MMTGAGSVLKLARRNLYDSVGAFRCFGGRMLRVFSALCLVVFGIVAVNGAVAAVVDNGPPYTDEQFLTLAPERLPVEFRDKTRLNNWWGRAPGYLRKHILSSKSEMWWPIVLCNYFGFRPDVTGELNSAQCERDSFAATQRGRNSWSADGEWIGPSEECRKRDKRSKWGELICD
jgi:hypothetical protein